jgi:peptide/nickel transport system permease protein
LPDDAWAPEARRAIVAASEREFALGGGVMARMARATGHAVRLELGRSWRDRRAVGEVIAPGLGATGMRALGALVLALALGVSLGLLATRVAERGASAPSRGATPGARPSSTSASPLDVPSRRSGSLGETGVGVLVALGIAVPTVWLCQLALAGSVRAAGSSTVAVIILAIAPAAVIATHVRGTVEEMLRSPLAAAIRARGASTRRIVWIHGARLAAPRLAPLAASAVGFALGAAPVIERVLALRGAGRTLADAAASGDVPVVAALAALAATVVALTGVFAHLAARAADPRLAEESPP